MKIFLVLYFGMLSYLNLQVSAQELGSEYNPHVLTGPISVEGARPGDVLEVRILSADFAPGIENPLRPFFGSMGVAPPKEAGKISSAPPWIHVGNLDNKELVPGTILFIPIHVDGANFLVGDGHAAQGNGEVDLTAIETSLIGKLQFVVRKDMKLTWPRAETPTPFLHFYTVPRIISN